MAGFSTMDRYEFQEEEAQCDGHNIMEMHKLMMSNLQPKATHKQKNKVFKKCKKIFKRWENDRNL